MIATGQTKRVDWGKALDLDRALVNVEQDLIGDWYRDPWSWPEIRFAAKHHTAAVFDRATGRGVRRVANISVPKEGFAARPAVVMDPVDRLLYEAMVGRLSKQLTHGLQPWVFGWRLRRTKAQPGVLARNDFEWERHRRELSDLVNLCSYGFKTDIVSCFASMPIHAVQEEIDRRATGARDLTTRLLGMLEGWDAAPGRRGLPQRNVSSSLLANMYLMGIDEVIHDYNASEAGPSSLGLSDSLSTRWMDDIWVFGQDEGRLRRLQVDLQESARSLGLELNSAKTHLYEGDDLAQAALALNHSAVDEGLATKPTAETQPLEDLLDELLANPESADRTSIHFACVRMRKHQVKSRASKLIHVARHMPHGADHISRVMRAFGAWPSLMDWYVEYLASDWARFDWSAAQLATMFPSKASVDQSLIDVLVEKLTHSPELPMFAVAVQRLIKWAPDTLRDVIREVEPRTDHPMERRILALGAVALRERRRVVRDLLGAYEENGITLRLLEQRDFRPLAVSSDFG